MSRGGAVGRKDLPRAKPRTPTIAMIAVGFAKPFRPHRRPHSTQNRAPIHARQPPRARRSPHSTQKLGRYIAGDSALIKADYNRLPGLKNEIHFADGA